jgi:hypothetical protein
MDDVLTTTIINDALDAVLDSTQSNSPNTIVANSSSDEEGVFVNPYSEEKDKSIATVEAALKREAVAKKRTYTETCQTVYEAASIASTSGVKEPTVIKKSKGNQLKSPRCKFTASRADDVANEAYGAAAANPNKIHKTSINCLRCLCKRKVF